MKTNIISNKTIQKIKNTPVGVYFYNIKNDPPHRHKTLLELLLCIRGAVKIVSADQKITLEEGDIFSIDCMDIHSVYSDDPDNIVLSLYIDLSKVNVSFDYLKYTFFTCRSDSNSSYQEKPLQDIKDMILSAAYFHLSETSMTPDKRAKFLSLITDSLIDILLKYFDWFDYMNTYPDTNKISRERFNRILSFCQQNYMNKITVSDIANNEFINENYLSQFLAKSPFQSFSNMINYIRCYESETMLLTTDLSNTEISYNCGFSDPKYFYKHFKNWYGNTPNQHRSWYLKRSGIPENCTVLDGETVLPILEKHIARYHMQKILSAI